MYAIPVVAFGRPGNVRGVHSSLEMYVDPIVVVDVTETNTVHAHDHTRLHTRTCTHPHPHALAHPAHQVYIPQPVCLRGRAETCEEREGSVFLPFGLGEEIWGTDIAHPRITHCQHGMGDSGGVESRATVRVVLSYSVVSCVPLFALRAQEKESRDGA